MVHLGEVNPAVWDTVTERMEILLAKFKFKAEDISVDCPFSPNGKACIIEVFNNSPYIPFVTLYDSSGLGYSVPQINATLTIYLLSS